MSLALTVCATPGCPNLTALGQCERCRRVSSRNHRGVARQARGYDRAYETARGKLVGQPCALRLPGCLGLADSADHLVPVSQGGRGGVLRPACHRCQSVQGARLARVG